MSYTIKENISDYYNAFKICNDKKNKGDLTPFIITFLEIIYKAFEKLYEALYDRNVQLSEAYENLERISFFENDDMKKTAKYLIQAALFSVYGISVSELCECMNLSESTIRKRIAVISDNNYISAVNVGKYKYYKFDMEKLI